MNLKLCSIAILMLPIVAWPQQDDPKGRPDGQEDACPEKEKEKHGDKGGGGKPHKGGPTVLVQVLTTSEDPANPGAPGDQSLLQQLFLVDLSKKKPLASIALGSLSEIVLSDDHASVWVIQRLMTAQARVRRLALPGFAVLADHTFPLSLENPSDPAGDLLSNQRIAALKGGQLAVVAIDPADADKTMALFNLSFCTSPPSFRKLTSLQPQQLSFSDLFALRADAGTILFPAGDALLLSEQPDPAHPGCVQLTFAASPGVTPLPLDAASAEGVRLAAVNPQSGRIIAVTSLGFVVQRDPAAAVNASRTETDASFPLELSVDQPGDAAAVRYKIDPTLNLNGVVVVNLATAQEVANLDVPSEGAIALLDATHLLFGQGADLNEMTLTDPSHPTTQKILTLKGVAVQRVLRLIPVPK